MMAVHLGIKPTPAALRFKLNGTVEDAAFETILPATPIAGGVVPAGPVPSSSLPSGLRILSKRASRLAFVGTGRFPGPVYWALVAVVAGAVFWMSGGYVLATRDRPVFPQTDMAGMLDNGMWLSDTKTRIEAHAAGDVIFVSSTLRNESSKTGLSPALVVRVEDRNGVKRDHRLVTERVSVAPGGRVRFESRIPARHGSVAGVQVSLRP